MLNWITPCGLLLKKYEEEYIDIVLETTSNNITMSKLSGEMPSGIELKNIDGFYHLIGKLPKVLSEKEFNFMLVITDGNEVAEQYFSIVVLNREVSWKTNETKYTYVETTYVSLQLELNNPNGNEQFVKIKGTLPPNLQISNTGLIYGNITDIKETSEYNFTIGVKRDNEYILTKDFDFTIKLLSEISEPIWVTTDELLGNINYNELSNIFVKAIDSHGLPIVYLMGDNSDLPYGLKLNNTTGKIEGICQVSYGSEWIIDIIASNGLKQVEKKFIIKTNSNSLTIDETINDLGEYKVGSFVDIKLSNNKNSRFSIISGNLPNGLKIQNNGNIYGSVYYQKPQDYVFTVLENNGSEYIQKEYRITVLKGLGYNSVKSYLCLNNEYMDDYLNIKNCFNSEDSYDTLNPKYKVDIKPKINVAICQTYDQILIRHLLQNINRPLSYIIGNTLKKSLDGYDVYYKNVIPENSIEANLQTSIHPYSRIYLDKVMEYYYSGTSIEAHPTSEVMVEYIIQDGVTIKTYYFIDNFGNKNYIDIKETYYEEGTLIKYKPQSLVYEESHIQNGIEYKKYYCDDSEKYTIFYSTIDYIRNQLSQRINVKKLQGEFYYKVGNQQLIHDNFEEREFIIKYDEDRKEYYAEYLGEKKYIRVYAEDENGNISSVKPAYAAININENIDIIDGGWSDSIYEKELFGGLSNSVEFETIEEYMAKYKVYDLYIQDGYENTDVNYHYYFVTEKDEKIVQENILFKTEWNPNIMFVNEGNEIFVVRKIDNPYVYDINNNSIGYPYEIVLPYVTDEDVNNNTICFFDIENENLIEWKDNYYPTLDLFYSRQNTNILAYNDILERENNLEYLYDRKILFYEIHFEPIYNDENIFTIDFYEHNNKNSPSFQLI